MAVYRLAYHFKQLPSEILNMSRTDFNRCLAYLQIEPPETPANTRTASLMAQIANFSGKTLKKGKTVSTEDYLSKSKSPQPQTPEQQKAIMRTFGKEKDK